MPASTSSLRAWAFGLGIAALIAVHPRAWAWFDPATVQPVTFEKEMGELGFFTGMANRVFKPTEGEPPYPAVVIGHTCGGLGGHIRMRARELLAAGFAVLVTDSYGPRGLAQCRGQDKVNPRHQAVDAYAALQHLKQMPEINPGRIYYVGYSAGGMAAALLAAPTYAPPGHTSLRFTALVSNYASCVFQHGPYTPRWQLLQRDITTPILMLMADQDTELRPADCFPQLEEMKAEGKPVEWHVFKNTHHAWDQPGVRYTHMTGFGVPSVYGHSHEATVDATRRMIEFFNRHR